MPKNEWRLRLFQHPNPTTAHSEREKAKLWQEWRAGCWLQKEYIQRRAKWKSQTIIQLQKKKSWGRRCQCYKKIYWVHTFAISINLLLWRKRCSIALKCCKIAQLHWCRFISNKKVVLFCHAKHLQRRNVLHGLCSSELLIREASAKQRDSKNLQSSTSIHAPKNKYIEDANFPTWFI